MSGSSACESGALRFGQDHRLATRTREELLVDTVGLDVVQARPLKVGEIAEKIEELLQP